MCTWNISTNTFAKEPFLFGDSDHQVNEFEWNKGFSCFSRIFTFFFFSLHKHHHLEQKEKLNILLDTMYALIVVWIYILPLNYLPGVRWKPDMGSAGPFLSLAEVLGFKRFTKKAKVGCCQRSLSQSKKIWQLEETVSSENLSTNRKILPSRLPRICPAHSSGCPSAVPLEPQGGLLFPGNSTGSAWRNHNASSLSLYLVASCSCYLSRQSKTKLLKLKSEKLFCDLFLSRKKDDLDTDFIRYSGKSQDSTLLFTPGKYEDALQEISLMLREPQVLQFSSKSEESGDKGTIKDQSLVLHAHDEAIRKGVKTHLDVKAVELGQHPVVYSATCMTTT